MRDSLKKLTLQQGMISRNDIKRLLDFPQLTEMIVGKRVLMDVYDIENLLTYSPKLVTLYIDGFQRIVGEHGTNDGNNNNNSTNNNIFHSQQDERTSFVFIYASYGQEVFTFNANMFRFETSVYARLC